MGGAHDAAAEGWPFLVARGRTVGFRVVLAPPFLVESRLTGLLMEASETADPPGDTVARREVRNSLAGDFTAFYRIVHAQPEMVGEQGGVLLDEGSRPIVLTEGIVFRGPADGTAVDAAALARMREAVADAYQAFWRADSPAVRTRPSEPLPPGRPDERRAPVPVRELPVLNLARDREEEPVPVETPRPEQPTPQQPKPERRGPERTGMAPGPVLALVLVALVLAVVAVVLLAAG